MGHSNLAVPIRLALLGLALCLGANSGHAQEGFAQEDRRVERELARLAELRVNPDPAQAAALARLLGDWDWRVRHDAAQTLALLGEAGIAELSSALNAKDRRFDAASRGLDAVPADVLERDEAFLAAGTLWWLLAKSSSPEILRRVALERPRFLVPRGEAAVAPLLWALDRAKDPLPALAALAELGPAAQGAVPRLRVALDSGSPDVRSSAADALVKLTTGEALVDRVREGHAEAAQALAREGRSLDALSRLYSKAPKSVRAALVAGLEEAVELDNLDQPLLRAEFIPLLEQVGADPEGALAAKAPRLMASSGDAGLPALLRGLAAQEPGIRTRYTRSIPTYLEARRRALGFARASRDGRQGLVALRATLAAQLVAPAPDLRLAALHALEGVPSDSSSVAAIKSSLRHDPDPSVRRAACGALTKTWKGFEPLRVLETVTSQDPSASVAAAATEEICSLEAWASVARLLSSSRAEVRREAAGGLMRGGALISTASLLNACRDSDSEVRVLALRALERRSERDEAALPALVLALGDSDPQVRRTALGLIGGRAPLGRLEESFPTHSVTAGEQLEWLVLLASRSLESEFLRGLVLDLLSEGLGGQPRRWCPPLLRGTAPGVDLIPHLRLALAQAHYREAALEGIAALGTQASPLRPLVRDLLPDPQAIVTLAQIGDASDAERLAVLLSAPDSRRVAFAALASMGPLAAPHFPELCRAQALLDESEGWEEFTRVLGRSPSSRNAAALIGAAFAMIDRRHSVVEGLQPWSALGDLGLAAAPALVRLMDCAADPDQFAYNRKVAARLALEIDSSVKGRLTRLLRESFRRVPHALTAQLLVEVMPGQIDPEVVVFLERRLRNPHLGCCGTWDVHDEAYALGAIGLPARAALGRLLGSADPIVRTQAYGALGSGPLDAQVLAWLRAGLRDDARGVRAEAASAVRRLAEAQPDLAHALSPLVPKLGELLFAEDWWLRDCAGDALAALGERAGEALPSLARALESYERRDSALKTLVRLGPAAAPARGRLQRVFRSRASGTFLAACVLAQLGDPRAREFLEDLLPRLELDLRVQALRSLQDKRRIAQEVQDLSTKIPPERPWEAWKQVRALYELGAYGALGRLAPLKRWPLGWRLQADERLTRHLGSSAKSR